MLLSVSTTPVTQAVSVTIEIDSNIVRFQVSRKVTDRHASESTQSQFDYVDVLYMSVESWLH